MYSLDRVQLFYMKNNENEKYTFMYNKLFDHYNLLMCRGEIFVIFLFKNSTFLKMTETCPTKKQTIQLSKE